MGDREGQERHREGVAEVAPDSLCLCKSLSYVIQAELNNYLQGGVWVKMTEAV